MSRPKSGTGYQGFKLETWTQYSKADKRWNAYAQTIDPVKGKYLSTGANGQTAGQAIGQALLNLGEVIALRMGKT